VVYLPLTESQGAEGFYLPPLEGMVMEKFVICPYAVGNADFCIPNETCLLPAYDTASVFSAILEALKMDKARFHQIIEAGRAIANRHTLQEERKAILELAGKADDLWQDDSLYHTDR
jgi:hypothetical protein